MDEEIERRITKIETEGIAAEGIDTREITANHLNVPDSRSIFRVGLLRGLGMFLIGASALVTAFIVRDLLDANKHLRNETACRFDVSTEVNSIADNIDALTADIFVEAIVHPVPSGTVNPRLVPLADEIAIEIERLRPAIKAREMAVETCSE